MENLDAGLREMRRVLRPGGQIAILEFTQPEPAPLRWGVHFAFVHALPAVAGIFSKSEAYKYLAESIRAWPDRRALAVRLRRCGFRTIRHELLHFRVAALHCALRANDEC
jgi:demethylmenaquinone methyltransferase/2-methoxy-6-polyprenyl-1,4-benzoquinol methylase